jgi:hypothetical protein
MVLFVELVDNIHSSSSVLCSFADPLSGPLWLGAGLTYTLLLG